MSDQNPIDQPASDASVPGPDSAPSTTPDPVPAADSVPPVDAPAPSDAAAPAASVDAGDVTVPAEPASPGDPTPSGDATVAAQPAAPGETAPLPGADAAPGAWAAPEVPGQPATAGLPVAPAHPVAPAYPAAAGYPAAPAYPVYPAEGYPPGYGYPGAPGGADPLVTSPAEGFSGWFSRLFKVIGTHWRSMYVIGLITVAPLLVLGQILGLLGPKTVQTFDGAGGRQVTFEFPHAAIFIPLALVFLVAGGLAGALGQTAFVWTITRQAVGRPAPLAEALRYGLRNAFRVWGWTLLYALLAVVGFCACVLPGFYVLLGGCLYLPVALYQRGSNPLSTSFSMVNKNFGAALGRMALLVVMLVGAQIVVGIPGAIAGALGPAVVAQLVSLVFSLIAMPLSFVTVAGTVLLFAELRARQHPLTSTDLDAVL